MQYAMHCKYVAKMQNEPMQCIERLVSILVSEVLANAEPMQSGHVEELMSCCTCSCLALSNGCKNYARKLLH